jgi:hypothetical protein
MSNKSRRDIHAAIGYSHNMLDRLMNPDITDEQLKTEVTRSKAVSLMVGHAIDGERVINESLKYRFIYDSTSVEIPIKSNDLGYLHDY